MHSDGFTLAYSIIPVALPPRAAISCSVIGLANLISTANTQDNDYWISAH
jgi:hypothetical protein